MVEIRNFSTVFRTKIDERIYSFDVIAVISTNLYSSLVGSCVVNTKTGDFSIGINPGCNLSVDEVKKIGRETLEVAKRIEEVIYP